MGENEHAIVFEEWSMDTDNEDKPASVLFWLSQCYQVIHHNQ